MPADLSAAFLYEICERPHDDDVRLIYADWLEDHGQPERAEFIRDQIADPTRHAIIAANGERGQIACGGSVELRGRSVLTIPPASGFPHDRRRIPAVRYERGFVDQIELTCADWLTHGPGLVLVLPLTSVLLSDVRFAVMSDETGGYIAIYPHGPDDGYPPWPWLTPGKRPQTLEDAKQAASTDAVSWARQRAKLPPLLAHCPTDGQFSAGDKS